MNHLTKLEKIIIGNKLRSACTDSKFSNEDIAHTLGLKTTRVLYSWFNGEKLPCTKNLILLKNRFNISLDKILTF